MYVKKEFTKRYTHYIIFRYYDEYLLTFPKNFFDFWFIGNNFSQQLHQSNSPYTLSKNYEVPWKMEYFNMWYCFYLLTTFDTCFVYHFFNLIGLLLRFGLSYCISFCLDKDLDKVITRVITRTVYSLEYMILSYLLW